MPEIGVDGRFSARDEYDLIVIGGGIQGVVLALEASLRGIRVLLLEKADWGSGTTYNWLRILHGGLRYLQSADLPRFFESVRERSWFLEQFPDLVAPLPCIMPLYKTGSHSPLLMLAAMTVNNVLSAHRNSKLSATHRLPAGRLMNREDVVREVPFIEQKALLKGAVWYDALVLDPQRLLVELLKWAVHNGAHALNYSEVVDVHRAGSAVCGVTVRFGDGEAVDRFRAPVVINATGHWTLGLASRLGIPIERAPSPSWAWNVLFDVTPAAQCAAAVRARRRGAQVFFVLPWQGRTLVGTGHALVPRGLDPTTLPRELVRRFVSDVREAVPALPIHPSNVARVFVGCLPAAASSDSLALTRRPMIVDHRRQGVAGLYSIWGGKYTTARAAARRLLRKAFGSDLNSYKEKSRPAQLRAPGLRIATAGWHLRRPEVRLGEAKMLAEEAPQTGVRHLDDLVLRRCALGDAPMDAMTLALEMLAHLPWPEERKKSELDRLATILSRERRWTESDE